MKPDRNLFRLLLQSFNGESVDFSGYSDEAIYLHSKWVVDEGCLENAVEDRPSGVSYPQIHASGLSLEGHELLEKLKEEVIS